LTGVEHPVDILGGARAALAAVHMAFQRRSFRRSSPSRFRRRRGGLRPSTEPQRWEACHFHIVDTLSLIAGEVWNAHVVELVNVHSAFLFTTDISAGRAMAQYAQSLDVAGITYDYSYFPGIDPLAAAVAFAPILTALYTDSLNAAGQPSTIGLDWSLSQVPVGSVSSQTIGSEDVDFPMRVHKKRWALMPAGEDNVAQSHLYDGIQNNPIRGHETVRLRRRFTDKVGLFFTIGGYHTALSGTINVPYQLSGTLYYRLRFGGR